MTTYFVATLACYVLVEAENEDAACERGRTALHDLYAERLGRETPIVIRTVREATPDEIDFGNWHHKMLAEELKQ